MIKQIIGITILTFATSTFAAGPSCSATSASKKLAGAAKNSFMKKCETDAKATCEAAAKSKKLAGAANKSFMKKCVMDAVGS